MTLLTHHIDAGWHEVEAGVKFAAEKLISLPGATASTVRVESDTSHGLIRAVTLREGQLAGRLDTPRDVTTNDGSKVTDGQHEALKTAGVTVVKDEEVTASQDEVLAAKDAEIDSLNEKLVATAAALDAAPTAEALEAKDKEIEDLKSEVAAANEALANALAAQADRDTQVKAADDPADDRPEDEAPPAADTAVEAPVPGTAEDEQPPASE